MNRELKTTIENDLKRVYSLPLTFKDKFFMPLEIKHLILIRKASYYERKGNRLLSLFYNLKLMSMIKKTHINIPSDVQIGDGFYIGHLGRIIINPACKIGKNVNIATGVTLGKANRGEKEGVPTIGNNVWIGTNSVIVGNVTIGDDVLIAPLSYVNVDVPSHSVVIGSPCQIHHKDNATEGYINRTI